ncbi:hypothetical protein IFM89_029676 [Coptis chinensis]|uniref:C2H2-type domain-containing protein n=1 Tax=Coptis chinensis TaxID=261450 RepID=A0A835IHA4_9MAGN|nr:hypothetical protein IFM89_029676 [Coptis chinensis]
MPSYSLKGLQAFFKTSQQEYNQKYLEEAKLLLPTFEGHFCSLCEATFSKPDERFEHILNSHLLSSSSSKFLEEVDSAWRVYINEAHWKVVDTDEWSVRVKKYWKKDKKKTGEYPNLWRARCFYISESWKSVKIDLERQSVLDAVVEELKGLVGNGYMRYYHLVRIQKYALKKLETKFGKSNLEEWLKMRNEANADGLKNLVSEFDEEVWKLRNEITGDDLQENGLDLMLYESTRGFFGVEDEEIVFRGITLSSKNDMISDEHIGIETVGGVMTILIPKNTLIPATKCEIFTTSQYRQTSVTIQVFKGGRNLTKHCRELGKFDLTGIAPAPRGTPQIEVTFEADVNGILNVKAVDMATGKAEEINCTLLLDEVPLTLGMETLGCVMTKLIPRKSIIPAKKSQVFSTHEDHQATFSVKVFEGERSLTKDCQELAKFVLSGITPAPRGTPEIEVTYEVDIFGVLKVKAKDKATCVEETITIPNYKGRRSQEQIDHIIREAEKFAEADKEVMEKIHARNNLETYIYGLKNKLTDGQAYRKEYKDAVMAALKWFNENPDAADDAYVQQFLFLSFGVMVY